jgi:hypothetical protein
MLIRVILSIGNVVSLFTVDFHGQEDADLVRDPTISWFVFERCIRNLPVKDKAKPVYMRK